MRLDDELALSFYTPVAELSARHGVWLVQHTQTGKFYVKKQMNVYCADVLRELRDHPVENVPRIVLLAEDGAELTVIEEYIPGETLQERLEREGPLPEDTVLDLALQLGRIVARLHHRTPPIVHRDIKPANLILTGDGVLKLVDWNAAKYADSTEARDTVLLGTRGYAAPEQYGFGPSAGQTDLYAVGAVMNVMLTGRFPTEQPAEGRLAPVIRTCTQLRPEDRFADADELIDVLTRLQRGESVDPSRGEPLSRRRFLPPGFRTGTPLHMVLAGIGYALLALCSTFIGGETDSVADLVANRIVFVLIGLFLVFFSANYLGVQKKLPLSRSRNLALRVCGVVLYDALGAIVLLVILVALESILLTG